ncbi:uncharacterized protein EV422DRAFT_517588 [Fimicolochytrium jonesii]|uniref:uncharacterized protein n=1 Tax=Fimicolochytrium jonesii TaxID=1396493 RepID=UPI0022FF4458|nr:uncharacterized protein EV422DRAFT_517588 [Fimicolochytrium jonesii]KAI8825138.1 hypothetical protein EV422DRAFT_517588 [Fimicolochytrium jonesii]
MSSPSEPHFWNQPPGAPAAPTVPTSNIPNLGVTSASAPLPPSLPTSSTVQQQQPQGSASGQLLGISPFPAAPDTNGKTLSSTPFSYGSSSALPPPPSASSMYSSPIPPPDVQDGRRMSLNHHPMPSLQEPMMSPPAGATVPGLPSGGGASPMELSSAESHVLGGPHGGSQEYRPLNVKDALSYLDQVKIQFNDQPEVYNRFLDIMKDFKSQALDTPGVIRRVSGLFREHPELISGFNTFLPHGYRIEPGPNGEVKVTTPRDAPPYTESVSGLQSLGEGATSVSNGTALLGNPSIPIPGYFGSSGLNSYPPGPLSALQIPPSIPQGPIPPPPSYSAAITSASNIINSMQSHGSMLGQGPAPPGSKPPGDDRRPPVEFNHAINYVNKIKNRFSSEPETYKHFLEILQTYQKEQKPIQEVYAQVQILFNGANDLLDEFKQFLPEHGNANPLGGFGRPCGLPVLSTINGMAVPQVQTSSGAKSTSQVTGSGKKQQRRPAPMTGSGASSVAGGIAPGTTPGPIPLPPPKKKAKIGRPSEKPSTIEELDFFDKCKKVINNKTTYNEFLKILNLFSQEIIEAKVLVERIEPFLNRAPDLLDWFKKFVKYEDDEVIYNIPAERPDMNVNSLRRLGHSYRQLPADVPRPKCSGRDDLCNEVLNDEWISHPVYVSETGFVSHKKTQFEEALHKCEEERYEFDMNIQSNLHVIGLLEPIAKKIQAMGIDERNRLKYSNGLPVGSSKTIYQRVIKKIYDKERGAEILEALHYNPAVAVPVVLKRLKQKDEEWKRAQRDWNKVWREIDAKNYYKALDHQGIHFKATDKKTMSAKSLVGEIETVHAEQRGKRATTLNRYQFDFAFKDPEVFKDVRALLRMQAQSSVDTDRRVINLLNQFTKRFFQLDQYPDEEESDDESSPSSEDSESDERNGDRHHGSRGANSSNLCRNVLTRQTEGTLPNGRGIGDSGDDLMDTEDDGDSMKPTGNASTAADLHPNALELDPMDLDVGETSAATTDNGEERRPTYVFYANSAFYVLIRQYQLLYSRLVKMKEMAKKLSDEPPTTDRKSSIAKELGLQKDSMSTYADVDRYNELLQACFAFVTGDLEGSEFEDKARSLFGTFAYLVFTVDKLCQAIIKQAHAVATDQKSLEIVKMYYADRAKHSTSPRQEAMYRVNSEAVIQEENLYRLEYFVDECVLTMQFLSKDEHITDHSVSQEDRWSLYIDRFVQLTNTNTDALPVSIAAPTRATTRREPFLKRTLPSSAPEEPPLDVEARSGIEMKVCVNTYKVFFVAGTEDFFARVGPTARKGVLTPAAAEEHGRKRKARIDGWIEGPSGWKRGLTAEEADRNLKGFETWLSGQGEGRLVKRARRDGANEWRSGNAAAGISSFAAAVGPASTAVEISPATPSPTTGLPAVPAVQPVPESSGASAPMEGVVQGGADAI